MTVVLPGLGVLTLAGLAPVVDSGIHINDVILGGGYSPTPNDVRLGNNLEPATSAVTTLVSPGVGALVVVGLAPSVAVSNNQFVLPGVGALTVVGLAPSVVLGTVSYPGAGNLTLVGVAPSVVLGTVAYPAVGAVILAGLASSVAIDLSVRPDVGVLTLAGLAPSVAATQNAQVLPDIGVLTLQGFAPDVQGDPVSLVPGGGFIQAIRRRKRQTLYVLAETFAPTVVTMNRPQFVAKPLPKPVAVTVHAGALDLTGYAPRVTVSAPEHKADSPPPPRYLAVAGQSVGSIEGDVSDRYGLTPSRREVQILPSSDLDSLPPPAPSSSDVEPPPVPAWIATPVVVDIGAGTLTLAAFAPSVDLYGAPWSPDDSTDPFDDEAFLLVALDYMEMV